MARPGGAPYRPEELDKLAFGTTAAYLPLLGSGIMYASNELEPFHSAAHRVALGGHDGRATGR